MNIASNYTLNVYLFAHRIVCRMRGKLNNNGKRGVEKKNILEPESTVWEMRLWLGVSWERWRMAMGYKHHMGNSETSDFSMVLYNGDHNTFLS